MQCPVNTVNTNLFAVVIFVGLTCIQNTGHRQSSGEGKKKEIFSENRERLKQMQRGREDLEFS